MGIKFRVNFPKFKLFALIILLLAGIFIHISCSAAKNEKHLIVKDSRSGEIYYSLPVETGDTFTMRYRHSVSGSVVEGTFEVTEQSLIKPLTTTYSSFGPGLPMDYSSKHSIENGLITVYHEEEPRDYVSLWVSPGTEEKIVFKENFYPLSTLTESHLLLDIIILAPR